MYLEPKSGGERENEDLSRMSHLYNYESPDRGDVPLEIWDKRAEIWDASFHDNDDKKRSTTERVNETMRFLRASGALLPDSVVVDAGCGVGHYAIALSKEAKEVLAIDISSQMIAHAKKRAEALKRENISFMTQDFHTIDLEKQGFIRHFDLVFASLSPASNGISGLEKLMAMSRKWCFVSTNAGQTNSLNRKIAEEVFDVEVPAGRDTRRMYALFNVLYLAGFTPYVYPYRQQKKRYYRAIEEDARHLLGRVLGQRQVNEEGTRRVLSWMEEHADDEGFVVEDSSHIYAWVLWDVNEQMERRVYPPDYPGFCEEK